MRDKRLQWHRGDRGVLGAKKRRSKMGFRNKQGKGRATSEEEGRGMAKERVAQREGIESGRGVNSRGKERDQGKGGGGCLR
jgi:hypothetical protein